MLYSVDDDTKPEEFVHAPVFYKKDEDTSNDNNKTKSPKKNKSQCQLYVVGTTEIILPDRKTFICYYIDNDNNKFEESFPLSSPNIYRSVLYATLLAMKVIIEKIESNDNHPIVVLTIRNHAVFSLMENMYNCYIKGTSYNFKKRPSNLILQLERLIHRCCKKIEFVEGDDDVEDRLCDIEAIETQLKNGNEADLEKLLAQNKLAQNKLHEIMHMKDDRNWIPNKKRTKKEKMQTKTK